MMKWYVKYNIWTADVKSNMLVMTAMFAILYGSVKESGLQQVSTRDLAIPMRRSNQLSHEATDVQIGHL